MRYDETLGKIILPDKEETENNIFQMKMELQIILRRLLIVLKQNINSYH